MLNFGIRPTDDVAKRLEGAFLEFETERFSATPFEEPLPHGESGPKAWQKLRRLTIATARLGYQVESYFTPGVRAQFTA